MREGRFAPLVFQLKDSQKVANIHGVFVFHDQLCDGRISATQGQGHQERHAVSWKDGRPGRQDTSSWQNS